MVDEGMLYVFTQMLLIAWLEFIFGRLSRQTDG
jgi:hypothetical protein